MKATNGADHPKGKATDAGRERQPVKKSDSFINSRNMFQSMSNTKQTKPVQKSESFTETRRKSSSSSTSSNSARTESVAQRKPHSARQDSHPAPDNKAQGKPHPARPDSHPAPVKRESHEMKSSISKSGSVSDSRPPSLSDSSSTSKHVAVPPDTMPHPPRSVAEPLAAAQTHSTEEHPHHASVHSSHTPSHSASSDGPNGRDAPSVSPGDKVKGGSPYKFTAPEQSGYVGFANLPNQVHRKSVKKGFEFTLMVVGESGLGKSTLVNSLFLTDLYPERHIHSAAEKISQTVKIDASTVEIEERGVKLRLTVVDTPGFGDSLNSQDCFKPIIQYIDSQFERYLEDESGLNRRHIVDNRVHCCFYFINPSGHGLRPLDISFMKAVHHKVNIVPVIAKSDTLTLQECQQLKRKVMTQIAENGINLYSLPDCDEDEDEDYREQCRLLKEAVPFAVIGANTVIEVKGKKVRGRMYPWGVVEVENPDHCDFIKLRTMLITHMQDLQEVTQEVHYENYRAEKLGGGGTAPKKSRPEGQQADISEREKQLQEKEQELRRMQEMITKMQAEMNQRNTPQKTQQNGEVKSQNV
uniref:Septin-2-like isoform X4 n=1 Tax=Crassostrea virginica TaxID=6565 RepID=A0A8B8EZT0_CRAVI|nr:septin-2-like isoform X4 [Crassostrea virginica]